MPRLTVDQIFAQLRFATNQFYSVEFERRTNRPDGTAVAGDVRTMLCRTGGTMTAYKRGVISDAQRDQEDFTHAVLTVWDVQAFMRARAQGLNRQAAGCAAWRRIDLVTLRKLSVVPRRRLPPDIRRGLHQIRNAFRRANMPRPAIP